MARRLESWYYDVIPVPTPFMAHFCGRAPLDSWISRVRCRSVQAVIVPSAAVATVVAGHGVRAHRGDPGPASRSRAPASRRAALRAPHGIAPQSPVSLYAGRLVLEKNRPFLPYVVARRRSVRPDIRLVWAGDGPARFLGYLERDGAWQDAGGGPF